MSKNTAHIKTTSSSNGVEQLLIYGKHAVMDAIKQRPDVVQEVYCRQSQLDDPKFAKHVARHTVHILHSDADLPKELERGAVHQHLLARIDVAQLLKPAKEFVKSVDPDKARGILVLGEIHDPHNVGALIRSATAFGCSAVLIPKHRQAPITSTVIKVSAGTAFKIPLVSVTNVNTTLRQLKDAGYWIYGLDADGDTSLFSEDFSRPTVLVVGNEGQGLREKTRELCDSILSIPMSAAAESLNASVSAAVTLAFWRSRQ